MSIKITNIEELAEYLREGYGFDTIKASLTDNYDIEIMRMSRPEAEDMAINTWIEAAFHGNMESEDTCQLTDAEVYKYIRESVWT